MASTPDNTLPKPAATTAALVTTLYSLSKRNILTLILVLSICGIIITSAFAWRVIYIRRKYAQGEENTRYISGESHFPRSERMAGQGQIESGDGPSTPKRGTWRAKMGGGWAKFGGVGKAKGKERREVVIGRPYNFKRYGGVGDMEILSGRSSLGGRVSSQRRVSWNGGVV